MKKRKMMDELCPSCRFHVEMTESEKEELLKFWAKVGFMEGRLGEHEYHCISPKEDEIDEAAPGPGCPGFSPKGEEKERGNALPNL